jgi:hypothetical protein
MFMSDHLTDAPPLQLLCKDIACDCFFHKDFKSMVQSDAIIETNIVDFALNRTSERHAIASTMPRPCLSRSLPPQHEAEVQAARLAVHKTSSAVEIAHRAVEWWQWWTQRRARFSW